MPPERKPSEGSQSNQRIRHYGDSATRTSISILPHQNTDTTTGPATTKEEEEDIQLPVLQHGFCKQPLVWKELTQIITDGEFSKLTRSESDQRNYEIFKRNLQRQWKSIYDYLLVDKFGISKECNKDNLWHAGSLASATRKRALARNDFPYSMDSSIEHWILWILEDCCTSEDIENAKEELQQQKKGQELEFLHWVNPPHLQSMPDIDHVHILVWTKPVSSNMMNNDS